MAIRVDRSGQRARARCAQNEAAYDGARSVRKEIDGIPSHPYAVAMETAMLAPKPEVSFHPWKEPKEMIRLAVRQVRSFLRAHRPATA
jgi:hypothetical protein